MRRCLLFLIALGIAGCAQNAPSQHTPEQADANTPDCSVYTTTFEEILCLQRFVATLDVFPNTAIYFLDETDKIVDGLLAGTLTEPQAKLALARVNRNTLIMLDAEAADSRAVAAQNNAANSAALMGLGLNLLNQSQQRQRPAFGTTSCSQVGNFLNCSHW